MRANLAFRERSRRVGIARLVCVDPIFKKCVESCEPSPNKKFVRRVLLLNACEKLSSKLGDTEANPNARWRVTSVKRTTKTVACTFATPNLSSFSPPPRPLRNDRTGFFFGGWFWWRAGECGRSPEPVPGSWRVRPGTSGCVHGTDCSCPFSRTVLGLEPERVVPAWCRVRTGTSG